MTEENETYDNGELMAESPEFADARTKANYTGHPELTYAAEQMVRDGSSQEEATAYINGELERIYNGEVPEVEVEVPHTFDDDTDAAGRPEGAVEAEAERVAEAEAAAIPTQGDVNQGADEEPKRETAAQRRAREKAEAAEVEASNE
jgi:hypothetical protein